MSNRSRFRPRLRRPSSDPNGWGNTITLAVGLLVIGGVIGAYVKWGHPTCRVDPAELKLAASVSADPLFSRSPTHADGESGDTWYASCLNGQGPQFQSRYRLSRSTMPWLVHLTRGYPVPTGAVPVELATEYRTAAREAGWRLVYDAAGSPVGELSYCRLVDGHRTMLILSWTAPDRATVDLVAWVDSDDCGPAVT